MELKQLEWFVRIAELGSLTRAAVELDVAQPALSRQVRNMERELGESLLIRTGRGVRVTEAGRVLVEHGRGILRQMTRLHEEIGRVRQGLVGRVAVGMPPSLSRALTVRMTKAFYADMPEAALTLSEGLSQAMLESVIKGETDLALVFNPTPSAELELVPAGRYPLYVVSRKPGVPASGTITLSQLAKLSLVIPSRPNAVRMEVENRLAAAGLKPEIRCEVDTIPGLLDLVQEGFGAAILPGISLRAFGDTAALQARRIVKPDMAVTLFMAQSARRRKTAVQQNTASLLMAMLGDESLDP